MKKDISKLLNLLEQFSKDPSKVKLKDDMNVDMDEFFAQKNKPIEDVKKIDAVFSKIPDDQFVVNRLLVNLEFKDKKKIRHYKKLFVSKYGGLLVVDVNYTNLIYLIYFFGLVPDSIAVELINKIINDLKINSEKKEYIPFLKGVKLHIQKLYNKAIDEFINATLIDSNFWLAHEYIAYEYIGLNEFRIAKGHFKKFFEFADKIQSELLVDPYLYMSYCYYSIKDFRNSSKFLYKCLKIDSKYIYANNLMGYSLYKLKEYDKAILYLDKSIKNGKDGLYPYWNKIQVYKATGNFVKAMEIIEVLKTKTKSKKNIQNEIDSIKKIKKKWKNKKSVTPPIVDSILEVDIEEEKITDFVPETFEKDTSGIQLETEKILEDLLEKRLLKGKQTFGKNLKIYDNGYYGRQFKTDKGRMDILTQNLKDNSYVIIELKRGKSDIEVVDQIQNYIDWTIKNLAKPNQAVKGIICIKEATSKLKALVKTLPDIELFEYEFNFIKTS